MSFLTGSRTRGCHVRSQEKGRHASGYSSVKVAPRIVPAALGGILLLVASFVLFMAVSPLYVSQVLGGRSLFAGAAILDDSFDVCLDIQQDVTSRAQLAYDAASVDSAHVRTEVDATAADAAFACLEAIAKSAAYEEFISDDGQAVLRTAYVSICNGHPAVLHANLGNDDERWVVIVGFQNVRDLGALSPENFLVIDPAQRGDGMPMPFDCQGAQLVAVGTELFIANDPVAVVSGEQVVALAHGAKGVQSGGMTQWSCFASAQEASLAAVLAEQAFDACDTVVLVGKGSTHDALIAMGLAGAFDCPVLPVSQEGLSEQLQSEIARLGAVHAIVVGGDDAVAASVERLLVDSLGLSVERIAGNDAVDTAIALFHVGDGLWGDTAIVAAADSPAEALAIAPYAYAHHAPVFLAVGVRGQLDAASYENLAGFQRVIIVGDTEAVAESVEVQLGQNGVDVVRLADVGQTLSTAIASWCLGEGLVADNLGIALDSDVAINLMAGAYCGKTGSVLLPTSSNDPSAAVEFVRAHASHMAKAWVCSSGPASTASTFARFVEATS